MMRSPNLEIRQLTKNRKEQAVPLAPSRSTPRDRRSEDVRIFSIIVAELEFSDIQRHVFAADLVESADTPRLKIDQKPSIVFV
jgi:hypothetical protein